MSSSLREPSDVRSHAHEAERRKGPVTGLSSVKEEKGLRTGFLLPLSLARHPPMRRRRSLPRRGFARALRYLPEFSEHDQSVAMFDSLTSDLASCGKGREHCGEEAEEEEGTGRRRGRAMGF